LGHGVLPPQLSDERHGSQEVGNQEDCALGDFPLELVAVLRQTRIFASRPGFTLLAQPVDATQALNLSAGVSNVSAAVIK
jgi:hypothetical protein